MEFKPLSFGNYRLLRRIAVGGMAEVFRAGTVGFAGFHKLVAVKRMLPEFAADAELTEMFVHEAKLAANLSHSNIVQILDFGRIQGRYFLAMEYLRGKDLWEINQVLKHGSMVVPVELVCHIFIEVLNGLEYLHNAHGHDGTPLRLIHRDLSPHNIMVTYEGGVKIIDFGIAKGAWSKELTATGILKGKYSYMSPEQARGHFLDSRSDIFSVAVCLVEMLTQQKVFEAPSDLAVVDLVREARFPPVRERNNEVPGELEDILKRALAREPSDRYATAGQFRDDLSRFLAGCGLRFSSSWLGSFMRELFREERSQESEELDREVRRLGGEEWVDEEQPQTLLLSQPGPVTFWKTANLKKHRNRATKRVPPPLRPAQENPPSLPIWYSSEESQLMRWVDQGVAMLHRRATGTEVVSRVPALRDGYTRTLALGFFLMALVVMLI